mmetsp:Transcript_42084/g.51046  ORF Transcript_42084/g.51046 Transcript_42084/m.51046 type:complete len:90 (+) Transcript_42084:45-314(+)
MGGHVHEMQVTRQDMKDAKIDLQYRDFCAHLLIPLNECRRENLFAPWSCKHEKHVYEKCQYFEYKRRVELMQEQKAAEGADSRRVFGDQ